MSAKWDMIATGKWMQKAEWNRWVTTLERDQSHKTPITSTWTADFLTREGEGLNAVGDWFRDKTISWKTRRRLLQTNTGISLGTPPDICRATCVASKLQRLQGPTMRVFNGCKMT